MPLYVNDFRADTSDLRADEIGIYLVLLMIAWKRDDAAIPNDMAWLKRSLKSSIAELHGHQFNRVVPAILGRYFVLGADDKWRNRRLLKERQNTDKRSANARQIANKRWSAHNEIKDLRHAEAMLSQSQVQKKIREGKKEPIQEGTLQEDTYARPPVRVLDGGRR